MTQVELKLKHKEVMDRAKMTSNFAEVTKEQPVTKENCITLERLARETHSAANALLSASAGNEEPRTSRG